MYYILNYKPYFLRLACILYSREGERRVAEEKAGEGVIERKAEGEYGGGGRI